MDQIHKHFEDACTFLEQKFTDETDEITERAAERVKVVDARFDELWATVEEHHGTFSALSARIDSKHSEAEALLQQQIEAEHQYCVDTANKLDQKVNDEVAFLEQKANDKYTAQDERMDETSERVHEHHAHFNDVLLKMDKKFSEKDAEQEELVEEHRKYFTALIGKMEQKFTEKDAVQDERIEAEHRLLAQSVARLDGRLDTEAAEIDHKFSEAISRMDKRLSEKNLEQDQRTDSDHRHAMNSLAKLEHKFRDETVSLSQQMVERGAAQDARTETLSAAVAEHYDFFADQGAKTERRIAGESAALDARIVEHYKHFSDVCRGLDQKSSSRDDMLAKAVEALRGEADARLTKLGEALASGHEQLTGYIEKMEAEAATLNEEQNFAIAELRRDVEDSNANTRVNVEARATDLDRELSFLDQLPTR